MSRCGTKTVGGVDSLAPRALITWLAWATARLLPRVTLESHTSVPSQYQWSEASASSRWCQARSVGVPAPAWMLAMLDQGARSSAVKTRFLAAVSTAQELRSGLKPLGPGSPSHFLNSGSPLSAPAQEPF